MSRPLKGRRIAVLSADGVEKVEISVPVDALKAAGAKVDIVSLGRGTILSMNLHEPSSRFRVDTTVRKANPADYDGLLIPGGFISPDTLRQSQEALEFVREFDRAHKPIASLCHGPWVLGSAGLLEGRALTSWPGIRDDMVNAGAHWLDKEHVHDGNLMTSRGPQDMVPFVRGILKHFANGASMERHTRMARSSRQRGEPVKGITQAKKWLPRPSLRGALIGGAAVAGILAYKNRERFRRGAQGEVRWVA